MRLIIVESYNSSYFTLLDYQATILNILPLTFAYIPAIGGTPRLYANQVHVLAGIVLMCALDLLPALSTGPYWPTMPHVLPTLRGYPSMAIPLVW